jgi:hypothetical protein
MFVKLALVIPDLGKEEEDVQKIMREIIIEEKQKAGILGLKSQNLRSYLRYLLIRKQGVRNSMPNSCGCEKKEETL